MTQSQGTTSTKQNRRTKILAISTLAVLVIYVIGLVNPYTGPALQYPYYEFFCGRKPVVASSFMGRYYLTPDMQSYRPPGVLGYDELYCTENEAMSHGYSRSL